MADSDFIVTISSPALSLLFYENVRNQGDQMGFLLGETLEFVGKTYTDTDNQVETLKRYNNIQAIVTCPLPECMHNSLGRINKEQLAKFLLDRCKQVVGWFHFRQNMNLTPTLRDKILHKEFASYFSSINGSEEGFFVACLLNSSISNEQGTHKFKHVFLRQRNGTLEPVPLRIKNLGSDSLEGSDYKPTPTRKSPDEPDMFSTLIESWNLNLTKMSEVERAGTIQKAAEHHFNQLIPRLCRSDIVVGQLEEEVRKLKLGRMWRINGNSRNVDVRHEIETYKVNEEKTSPSKGQSTRTVTDLGRETYIEKNVNADKSRRRDTNIMNNASQESLPTYSVPESIHNITESFPNKSKRSSVRNSEIVKESICKGNGIGIGRGAGKPIQNTNSEPRKGRTTSGPTATRSSSESTLHTGVSKQESSQANRVQNMPFQQASYSEAAKKKVHNIRK